MRVARRLSDGRILEAQSNDATSMDALKRNVGTEGVEFVVLPDAEVSALIAAQNPPQPSKTEQRLSALEADVADIKSKLSKA